MRINIHHKITLILTGTIAVVLLGTYVYLNNALKQYTYQRIETTLSKEVSLARIHLEKTFNQSLSIEEIDDIADRIGGSLKLRATIIGLDGTVLGDSDIKSDELKNVENHLSRVEIQAATENILGKSRRFSTTIQKDMLYMAHLFGENSKQGFLRLAIPLSDISLISNNLKRLLFLVLLFAFLFTIIVGSTAFIFVSKPIKEISSVAQEIARGNYSKRASISTNDEMGDLAKSINYMCDQITNKIEEVISNKSRFETVLLSMCEGTMVVDKKGSVLLMNDVLSKFFRVNADPIGRKPLEVIRNIEIQEMVDNVLQSKTDSVSEINSTAASQLEESILFEENKMNDNTLYFPLRQEISILIPEEKIFQVYAAPVLRDKELDGAVLVFHEITELRRLENVRKDFVANVSHEIRTPLTSIKGYAETLLEGAIHDKKNANDFLKIISLDSNRLVQLVDDLLDLSKIESGKLNLRIASHFLEPIIDRIITGLKEQSLKSEVTLRKEIPLKISKVKIDDAAIAQVLLNLLNNAIKYNKKGGAITISVQDNNTFIKVDIEDTGIGIPEEDIPRIFERFYRVDKARSRELGGTGLGLSIVKHIIQAHHGEVSVHSELEKGSIFSFTIPKA